MTPVFYVFYMIFGFTLFPSPESEKKLNDLLKTARLMVNHHTLLNMNLVIALKKILIIGLLLYQQKMIKFTEN